LVQLPTIFVSEDVMSGRLVDILPDWRPESGIVHAVFPSRRGLVPTVRALLDFLARECAIQRARGKDCAARAPAPRLGRRKNADGRQWPEDGVFL
jgi:hypothetical protein